MTNYERYERLAETDDRAYEIFNYIKASEAGDLASDLKGDIDKDLEQVKEWQKVDEEE